MSMYDYEYEWDSRYCYPNSNVLKNKLDIRDAEKLSEAERRSTALNLLEMQDRPVRGKLDFNHLCAIHRAIFRDIFDWAGKPRTVNISKGNPFCMSHVLSFDKEYAKMNEMFRRITAPTTEQEQRAFRKKLGLGRT